VAVAIILERAWTLASERVIHPPFVAKVEELIKGGMISEAIALCKMNRSAISNILLAGISNYGRGRTSLRNTLRMLVSRKLASCRGS